MAVSAAAWARPRDRRRDLFFSMGCLVLVNSLTAPTGLPAVPLQFYLKDHLHLLPETIALFGLVSGIPHYLSFVFGFVRDRWSPFGWGDRGHFLCFAPLAAALYLWIPAGGVGWARLLAGVVLVTALYRMLASAQTGLIASMARRDRTTGAFSALSTSMITLSAVVAPLLGGWLTDQLGVLSVYPITALGSLLIFAMSLRGARFVFSPAEPAAERPAGGWTEIKRLARYRPLGPALLICALWQFAPAFQTPLFFHLTETVGLSAGAYGQFPRCLQPGAVCRDDALWADLRTDGVFPNPQVGHADRDPPDAPAAGHPFPGAGHAVRPPDGRDGGHRRRRLLRSAGPGPAHRAWKARP